MEKESFMRKCEDGRFGYRSDDAKILGITGTFRCIDDLDFRIQGGYESSEQRLFQVNVDYCN